MANQDYIASDEALARYLQYASDDESNASLNANFNANLNVSTNEHIDDNDYDDDYELENDATNSNDNSTNGSDSDTASDKEFERTNYAAISARAAAPPAGAVTRRTTNARFAPTLVAPQGLHVAQISDAAILADALREANSVFDGECAGQIATNQHFFVNLPFPIGGSREAGTALFALDDERIPRLSELIRVVLRKLSFVGGNKKVMHEGMLARANLIVRKYSKGQHISFHVDEKECASSVFGFILQNDHPQHKGLEFRRGEDKQTLSYVMQEHPGTAFILTHEARYKWKHGLVPVSAVRVSVTCRFFKTEVFSKYMTSIGAPKKLKSWQIRRLKRQQKKEGDDGSGSSGEDGSTAEQTKLSTSPTKSTAPTSSTSISTSPSKETQQPAQPLPAKQEKSDSPDTEATNKPEEIHVELCLNKDSHQTKPALVNAKADIKQLIGAAKNKLRVKAKKFFVDGVTPVTAGYTLTAGDTVYVSLGEDFNTKNKKSTPQSSTENTKPVDPNSGFGISVVQERIAWWSSYHYAQLRFWVAQDNEGQTPCRGTPVANATQLGDLVAASFLSIPELREIVLALRDVVEDLQNGLAWGFHSTEWENGRSTSVCVMRARDGAWVEFVSEGKPTVKGARKRDGPLWKLEGGLNNPAEAQNGGPVKLLSEVAAEVTQDLEFSGNSNQRGFDNHRDDDGDDVGRRKRKPKKKKEQNAYQSKRGVEFTDKYVLFAGTVWCSSYYACSLEIDGIKYTSSTQFVMSEQAKLFGDEVRRQELLAAIDTPAPHREFDHKAPKTGVRRVNNFDADVWKTYKERLMWRGTYEKFTQNPTLLHKALEAGDRTFVEATEDPMWGIGICLSHPDAKNEKRWRGPNLMGRMLTCLARLLKAETTVKDPLSRGRVAYLQELAGESVTEVGDVVAFGVRALDHTGDPDRFPVPGWPGTASVREATNLYKSAPATVEAILESVLDDVENSSLRHAKLYLVEGVLGLRWL